MDASTDLIRDDIQRTQEALATCENEDGALRGLLERQLVALVALLARNEVLWAQAQARGAGVRTQEGSR